VIETRDSQPAIFGETMLRHDVEIIYWRIFPSVILEAKRLHIVFNYGFRTWGFIFSFYKREGRLIIYLLSSYEHVAGYSGGCSLSAGCNFSQTFAKHMPMACIRKPRFQGYWYPGAERVSVEDALIRYIRQEARKNPQCLHLNYVWKNDE